MLHEEHRSGCYLSTNCAKILLVCGTPRSGVPLSVAPLVFPYQWGTFIIRDFLCPR